ncbi:MAG: hypothetical protein PHI85_09590 [Victivallaceae bacterium]|nr:hypothetical protein [Victivallaceae bacterium]
MSENRKKYRSLKSMPVRCNALYLSFREMVIVIPLVLAAAIWLLPYLWEKSEKFDFQEPDFRISYDLRDDYWSYRQWVDYAAENYDVMFVGDSVVWGMYTDNAHTLSHCYNAQKDEAAAANLGIDGLHPVALEGLMADFGRGLRGKKIYLYFNALWMNSEKFDLTYRPLVDEDGVPEKLTVMHPRLIPQFDRSIEGYGDPLKKRMAAVLERNLPICSLLNHLRGVWYDNKSLAEWMLVNPSSDPLTRPGFYISAVEREHRNRSTPWNKPRAFEVGYDWVPAERSLQLKAFIRAAKLLEERGNEVTVVVGAFNTHMLDERSLEAYGKLVSDAEDRLDDAGLKYLELETLPSESYADASHPLDAGYENMAEQIIQYEEE